MARAETTMSFSASPQLQEGVQAYATAQSLTVPEALEQIVRTAVIDFAPEEGKMQMQAETEILDFVKDQALTLRDQGNWSEDVTGEIFNLIKRVKLEVYSTAIGGQPFSFGNDDKARINRKIGARIKRLLDAEVVMENGKRAKVQPSRTEDSLVMSYSRLRPSQSR